MGMTIIYRNGTREDLPTSIGIRDPDAEILVFIDMQNNVVKEVESDEVLKYQPMPT